MNDIVDFNKFLEIREKAKIMAATQQMCGEVVRGRQSSIIFLFHKILDEERKLGLLTEVEIIEISKVLFNQISDGIILT